MRIAQVAPLYESVPPRLYGGTERVVSYLTEALAAGGHDVTLFASGDSTTRAELVPVCERALRLDPSCIDPLAHHVLLLETVAARAREFDVIHYHTDYLHFPLSRRCSVPQVTTLHGRLDIPDLIPLYREFSDMPVISISHAQRKPLPWLNWQATIYHGLPVDLYHYHPDPRGHLAFIGRVSPDKGIAQAIEIAIALDMPLRIAAKIGESDREYFRSVIRPLLDHPLIEYVGEVGDREKEEILGDARAVLFPISWPEPFGLTMIESMACGTPVVAFNQGSVPEVIEHGKTGFLVSSLEEAVEAVKHIDQINRGACRAEFVRRFSADRIADDYARAYQQLAGLPAGLVAAGTLAGVAH